MCSNPDAARPAPGTVTGTGGGPEKTLLNSPRFLRGAYQLRLAYIHPEGDKAYDLPERAARLGVDLLDLPERGALDPRTLSRLVWEVFRSRPHILHAHDYKTNVLSVLLGYLCGARVLTTLHGYVTRGGRLEAYYLVDRWAVRAMDHAVAVSADLDRTLVSWGMPRSRRSLIENAIDSEDYRRRLVPAEAKVRLGLDPARLVVGAAGRLSPEKGFDVLIRAVAELVRNGRDLLLLIAGEGDDRPRLEALISELNLPDSVRLLGHRADLRDWYEAMDVFVLSSLREGLPNVVLESMALEVPTVATRIAGVPNLIEEDGQHGLLVEPGDASALAKAVDRLLVSEPLRRQMASAARQRVEQRFSFAARMERIRRLYDHLLGRVSVPVEAVR